ncbi:type II toxin-antitoxin system RelE/ParE family toxin [bacterium]|nr:type II toxin-antitoxin system RelE/ParE family toxin [bacterium]
MTTYLLKNFVDNNGKEPIKLWLNSLDNYTQKRILMRLRRLELGNFGDYKQLNSFLYELRFTFGSGYRIYFAIENSTIILLINGGDKKTQKKDIGKANEIIKSLKGQEND